MPFGPLKERSQGQSCGVTRPVGERGKSDDWSIEKFEGEFLVWTEASVRTTCWDPPTPGKVTHP